jgi:hypothetical protein
MHSIVRGLSRIFISLFILSAAVRASAQSSIDTNSDQIAALQLQLTNAWQQVETIINQPVRAYRRDPGYDVSVYGPGWFHPGAETPDFNNMDVRKSQQLIYTATWVSSDVTPNMMFRGSDLEFNAMTKLFYTNRSLPKKKLSEAEMLQINSLYRTIGHCQSEIAHLQNPLPQNPPAAETAADDSQGDTNDTGDTDGIAPGQSFVALRSIPQQTRILYGSIAIGALVLAVIVFRLFKKKSD